MSKKIVFLVYSKVPTGGLKVLFKVGNGLLNRGYDVSFLIAEEESAYKLEYQNSCNLIHSKNRVPYRLFNRLFFLLRTKINADVIIATYFPTAIAGYFNKDIKGKLIYYVQADESHFFSFRLLTLVRRFHYFALAKISYMLPIEKVVNCNGSKASLSKDKNYVEIPPGFDPTIYFPKETTNKRLKIGHISRIEVRKGSAEFFLAMKHLRESGVDFDLFIAYDFCDKTQGLNYESVSPKSEAELAHFYRSCDIVVSTVWEKGFAYPPLETMACGSISISTPIDYGSAGNDHISIPINDYLAIQNSILWVVNNPEAAELVRQSGIKTASNYTWDQVLDRWETVL